MRSILILGPLFFIPCASAAPPQADYERFFHALYQVESAGQLNPPAGDNGRSIGPFQIWRAYWLDSRVPGRYQDCLRLDYSKRVVTAYMQRYAADAWRAGDWQTLARIHNGGPKGASKKATIPYWEKIKKEMKL